jgi:hypothetical protein
MRNTATEKRITSRNHSIPESASNLSWDCLDVFLAAQDRLFLGVKGLTRFTAICDRIMEA